MWRFYELIRGAVIINPHLIPVLFGLKWSGEDQVYSKVHVGVSWKEGVADREIWFSTLSDVAFDIGVFRSYRGACVSLYSAAGNVYAFLRLNIGAKCSGGVEILEFSLSPVPFDRSGKSRLPGLPRFLEAASLLVQNPTLLVGEHWCPAFLATIMERRGVKLKVDDAAVIWNTINKLQICAQYKGVWQIAMTPEKFVKSFGVELPKQEESPDWLSLQLRREVIAPYLRKLAHALALSKKDLFFPVRWVSNTAQSVDIMFADHIVGSLEEFRNWLEAIYLSAKSHDAGNPDVQFEELFAEANDVIAKINAIAPPL